MCKVRSEKCSRNSLANMNIEAKMGINNNATILDVNNNCHFSIIYKAVGRSDQVVLLIISLLFGAQQSVP